ncbi:MAG: saccharopine dehydrogenase NADP-binding domain-containing protein [Rubrivivax sp.]
MNASTRRSTTPRKAATASPRRLDLVLFGATGFTGRQAVRALLRQRPDARWGVAGRDAAKLGALVEAGVPEGARAPKIIVADAHDAASLKAMARQAKVLLNLAGPYHATGDAVVAACIEAGTHYLDLTGETFWIQRLVREQHEAAVRARVKVMPCAGYEALPFDLANLWAAHQLRRQCGEACASVRIIVRLTGRALVWPQDMVSGGTAATITELLEHDHTDCLRDMACLLPPDADDAAGVARRNALQWLPRYDAELQAVTAPAMPGPFINPPVVLRGVALMDDPTLFDAGFSYHEGTDMGSLMPGRGMLPARATLALQWAAAAAVAAPLANLGATIAGPLQFQRELLGRLLRRLAPRPGTGPSDAALDAIGYELQVFARGARGARFRGRVVAQGHPGYRSTPEMAVCVALGLADGTLGKTPHFGVVSPAAGLGIEAVPALAAAGVSFKPEA